ncbi:MAG TPA: PDZ domain-containing protein [Vicinamibacteria bacterium]
MKGRIAFTTGAAAVFLASFCLGLADVRAGGDDDDKIETKIVARSGSGRLGVTIGDTTGESRGATVRSVAEDSAAEKAGVKEGDVIVRFDGETVRSASHLTRLVSETPAGRAVAIEVTRDGATQKLTATLAEGGQHFRFHGPDGVKEWSFDMPEWSIEPPDAPLPPPAPGVPRAVRPPRAPHAFAWKGGDGDFAFRMLGGGPRKLGIEYMELGEQLAAYFKAGSSSVLVTSVDEAGPAAKAGIRAGDVIVKLAGATVSGGDDLRQALSDAEGGSEVAVTVQRDGRPVELKVTLAKPDDRIKRREARGVSL